MSDNCAHCGRKIADNQRKTIDTNGDGAAYHLKCFYAVKNSQPKDFYAPALISTLCRLLDDHGDGMISRAELAKAMRAAAQPGSRDSVIVNAGLFYLFDEYSRTEESEIIALCDSGKILEETE
jgi:hypothetical protein